MDTTARIDYVYILGASHSGSTLLAMLLNAHPAITTIGETAPGRMGDLDTYLCSCGDLIKDCPFWKSAARRMQEEHPDFRLDNLGTKFQYPANPLINRFLNFEHRGILFECVRDTILRLSSHWKETQRDINARCRNLACAVLAESGGHILVDSSKIAHRLKFLLFIPEFNIKVIHLVRDGRAVALTYMRQDEFADSKEPALRRGGRGMSAEETAVSLSMEKAANEWRRCLLSAEHLLARLERSQWIQFKYEELCNDPTGTLRTIYSFLGIDCTCAVEKFRSIEHHVIGNGMRLDRTSSISLDERWRSVLTEKELRTFDREAGRVNRRYGYE